MNIRFVKTVAVDYEEARSGEIKDITFNKDHRLRDVALEPLSRNFSNIHFVNGDLAISVPTNSFQIEER